MLTLEKERDQAFVLEAQRDWEAAGISPTLILEIGGEDYSDRIPDGDVSQDGIAIDLEANFAGHLPLRLYGAPVNLDLGIGGVRVPMLRGLVSLPEPNDDRASTKLMAASAGSLADKYPLNERIEYSGVRPDYVVRDALRRLPYTPGSIRVENVDGPHLYFARGTEDGPFEKDQHVSDILSKVSEKVPPFSFRDNQWGGHDARISAGLARPPEVPDYLRFRAEELIFWKSPVLALEQYAKVRVYRDNPDGTDAFEPAIADVRYTGRDFPPPAGAILPVAFTGTDVSEAWRTAYLKALELGRGLYKSEPILSFHPLLQTTDFFTVTELKDEDGTLYEREWLHYVDTYEQIWNLDEGGEAGFETKPVCSVTLLNEDQIKAPTLALSLVTGGVIKTLVYFVNNSSGFYREPETTGDYVTNNESGFFVDPDLSGGRVAHTGSGFSFQLD